MKCLWATALESNAYPKSQNGYTYIHTYIHTYMHACIQTYIHTYIRTYIHTYMHTNIHTYVRTYVPTYIHACMHACMHTYIHTYIHTYMHTNIHTYVRTYVPTYIHTYIYIYIYIYIYRGMHINLAAGKTNISASGSTAYQYRCNPKWKITADPFVGSFQDTLRAQLGQVGMNSEGRYFWKVGKNMRSNILLFAGIQKNTCHIYSFSNISFS